jgi:TonB-linked SusC/RagA family outer membrane protein
MKKCKQFLSLFFLLTFALTSMQAQRKLTGKVVDSETNEILIGASITIKESNIGTITDFEGRYELELPDGNVSVEVSYVGYQTKVIEEVQPGELNMQLTAGEVMNEIVVVGYTSERKKDLTGAVSVVKLNDVKELPNGNIMKNIQGRVAGVNITTDGSPGSVATVRIRGNGTLNNNDPLYVIDGVPTKAGMHEINSADIESIQVLKDAASASVYGARAGNGVIVITTKNAKTDQLRVQFDANWSGQQYTSKLEPLNTRERGLVFWQASVNAKLNPSSPIYNYLWNGDVNRPILGDITFNEYIDAKKTMRPSDTRWFDEVSQASLMQSYNLNLSKGSKNGNVVFSMGYYDHDGIIKETNFNRINFRLNTRYNLLDGLLSIGNNFQMTVQREKKIPTGDILFTSLVQHPIVPVRTETGGWGGPVSGMTDRQNPVRLIEDNKHNSYRYVRPFGNVFIELNPIKNVQLKSSFGVDYSMFNSRNIQKRYVSGFLNEPDNRVTNNSNLYGNWIWTNTATYDLIKSRHRFNFLLGQEQIKYSQEYFSASREGFISESTDYAYLSAGATNQLNSGGGQKWALLSYFSKINYSFNDRYLVSFTVRRDGSSRFGKNNRFGNFPAASIGWRISEEPFFKNLFVKPVELKLRASWGQNGNQEIDPLAVYNIYRAVYDKEDPIWDNPNPPTFNPNLGTAYDIYGNDMGQLLSGFINSQQASDDLKWETTTQTNFGLDYEMGKFSGSVDYYVKETSDILYFRTLLATVGEANGQFVNGGNIRNKGIEALLTYSDKVGELSFDITGNMATLTNEVVSMPDDLFVRMPLSGEVPNDAKTELPGQQLIGLSVNSFYGYVADGLFQNQAEVDLHATQPGKDIGRIRFKDINGDNKIDNNDQTFIGTADPSLTFGLNINLKYKQFNLMTFFQGVSGIEYYNAYKTYTDFASLWPGTNWGVRTLDAWSVENPNSTIPRLTIVDNNNEGRVSTYFIENASYLKLRNLQLGYQLPSEFLKKFRMRSAKIYIQGQNIWTLKSSEFTAPDPENPNYAFPIPATTTLGINLEF